ARAPGLGRATATHAPAPSAKSCRPSTERLACPPTSRTGSASPRRSQPMRTRFKPSPEQRAGLRAQLARVQQPEVAYELIQPVLPEDFIPTDVPVLPESVHPDRFSVRAEAHSGSQSRAFALKGYADDFVSTVWAYSRSLAQVHRPNHRALSLPLHYNPAERILVSAWVSGPFLSDILDERKPDLLREAARLAAEVHRLPLTPERLTTAEKLVAE